ncbi:hypothetical protein V6N12_066501 [Hibiscus sabdariffa]|uniref:RING-type E3 ubiquitin transferase n=1 Tax=Hibiscus sabdariffa TaxID=183260 RepID=A0ABR2CQU1_9ROSI
MAWRHLQQHVPYRNTRCFSKKPIQDFSFLSLHEVARFLRRASSRRMMREPSMLVRETATEQLEERQRYWAYSKSGVVLDIIWNMAFLVVPIGVFFLSKDERPEMPLRL